MNFSDPRRRKSAYCGPMSLSPIACLRGWAQGGILPDWPQFEAAERVLTYRCRTALNALLPALGLASEAGVEVLAPAYNCGSEIDAILGAGIRVRLYDVSPTGELSTEAIAREITPACRAIYVIHYFGWAQDLAPIRRLCDEQGLLLIEDCALALFTKDSSGCVGGSGDMALFSLVKYLPVPDGAVTLLRKPLGYKFPRRPVLPLFKECGRLGKRYFFRALSRSMFGLPPLLSRGRVRDNTVTIESGLEPMPNAYYYDSFEMDRSGMSRVTLGLIGTADPIELCEVRRSNYLRLTEGIKGLKGIRPLYPMLPSGACPVVAPFVVDNRHALVHDLTLMGAHPIAWWSGYHSRLDFSRFPNARYLKDSVLALPIHQEINDNDIDFLIDCVRRSVAE